MIAVALRAPTAPESFALSVASTALAIILAGVVLILIADAVDLSPAINRWPLVTLGVVIVAVAAVSLTAGQRSRAENLARDLTAPWASAGRLEALEQKVEALLAEEQVRPEGGADPPRAPAPRRRYPKRRVAAGNGHSREGLGGLGTHVLAGTGARLVPLSGSSSSIAGSSRATPPLLRPSGPLNSQCAAQRRRPAAWAG